MVVQRTKPFHGPWGVGGCGGPVFDSGIGCMVCVGGKCVASLGVCMLVWLEKLEFVRRSA